MKNLRNRVTLIGNLGKDPEFKTTESGKKMAKLTLATNSSYKNSDGHKVEDTQWHTLVAWEGIAGVAEKYLKKGKEIAVEGKLNYRSYEDANGQKKFVTEIVVHDLLMLS